MSIGNTPPRWSTVQTIVYAASSVTATNAVGTQTYALRLIATSGCHVSINHPGNAAVAATDAYVGGGATPEYVACSPGDKISAIQESAGGTLYITELTY